MKSDWFNFERELDKWGQAGSQACFWWRDDDLEAPGPRFQRLLELRRDAPLSLAVIPKMAKPQIAKSIGACKEIDIIQHGFAHKNYETAPSKRSEFGINRTCTQVHRDLSIGKKILSDIFGTQFLPVIAPPWNRIAMIHSRCLVDLDFHAISGFGKQEVSCLQNINTHIDPISWKKNRAFKGARIVLENTVRTLKMKRKNAEYSSPTGLLTHHKQMDEDNWRFIDQFIVTLQSNPHVTLKSIREIMRLKPQNG